MFKEVMNDLWLARISSLSNEVGWYVVLGALPCPRISSTNETNRYNITKIFLKMALK
jgi:hypothetical protein